MQVADIVVHPARFEGKAVAVEESLVMNLPIIVTDYSSANDQIENNITGFIVPFDKDMICNKINLLFSSHNEIEKIKSNQKRYCKGNSNEIKKLYSLLSQEDDMN